MVAFAVAFLALRILLLPALARRALDQPNLRSLHKAAVPRTGGLGVTLGSVAGMALAGGAWTIAGLALLLMCLSVIDDLRDLSPGLRLAGHLAAAAAFVVLAGGNAHPAWVAAVAILAMVWMINLYNFMDGADGLAGGMAVVGFGTYAWLAWSAGDIRLACSAAAVVAAALAFLLFNFPPARMFLGDGGSVPLGFMAAAIGFAGWTRELWPAWFPLVAFAMFVVDASVTLLRRAMRGEKVWQAHRSHYYQRLVLMGWSHRRLAAYAYCLMAGTAVLGIVAVESEPAVRIAVLASLGLLHLVIAVVIDSRWNLRVKT